MTTPTQSTSVPRSIRILLILSLALNLLVVGLVAGAWAFGPHHRQPRGVDLVLGPVARALDEEDRRAIRDRLIEQPELRRSGRAERRETQQALITALRAEPFDPDALASLLDAEQNRAQAVQRAAREAFLARLAEMEPQARRDFADRLASEMRRGPERN